MYVFGRENDFPALVKAFFWHTTYCFSSTIPQMLDILIPSSIITTIIILIITTIIMIKEKSFSVLKFYLTIVSTVSLLGFVIAS